MAIVLIVGAILVLSFVIKLAISPVRTMMNILRALLFIAGLAFLILWIVYSEKQDSSDFEALWFAISLGGLWLLTFIIPAFLRRSGSRR